MDYKKKITKVPVILQITGENFNFPRLKDHF